MRFWFRVRRSGFRLVTSGFRIRFRVIWLLVLGFRVWICYVWLGAGALAPAPNLACKYKPSTLKSKAQ
jgi:hypothetical protein